MVTHLRGQGFALKCKSNTAGIFLAGPSPRSDVLELKTGKPYSMVVEGSGMTLEDRIVVLKASKLKHCDGSVLSFAATMVGLYQSSASGAALLNKGLMAAQSIAASVSAVSLRESSGKISQTFASFTLKNSGEYVACWNKAGSENIFLARTIVVNGMVNLSPVLLEYVRTSFFGVNKQRSAMRSAGFDVEREYPALYAPSATGSNQRPFPIFIPFRGSVELPARDAISFHKMSHGACQGDVVGRSRETSFLQVSSSGDLETHRAVQAS